MSAQLFCPVCGSPAAGGEVVNDATFFLCPRCGGYWLARTLLREFQQGPRKPPQADWFRELVKNRSRMRPYPTINRNDIGG
jgi:Zn-finger nucleic acid-binding protein